MDRRQQSFLIGGIFAVCGVGGWLYAGPYITLYQMYQAINQQNALKISEHVDFPALRESVKSNLSAVVTKESAQQGNAILGLLGAALGSLVASPVIDAVVTPEGVAALLQGQQLQLDGAQDRPRFSKEAHPVEVQSRYESFNQFSVSVKPKGQDAVPI
ncbi:MAG: DUF2939 domain-containing protein, partial [Thermosynechococcaceae cyanobacterium]